jgi:hypothetical protein
MLIIMAVEKSAAFSICRYCKSQSHNGIICISINYITFREEGIMKKLISFLLVLAIVLSLVPVTKAQAAVKINKSKATLEVDAALQLKITGSDSAVNWTSSKDTVAKVSSNGAVTAVKAGTATITATVDSKDYACEVYVVNSKNTSISVGETIEFTSGEYLVGEDIPVGTYTLTASDGSGVFKVYNSQTDFESDKASLKWITLAANGTAALEKYSNMYSLNYKNLRVKKGQYIIIDSGLILDVKRTK